MANYDYLNYYVVVESDIPDDVQKKSFELLKDGRLANGLNFVRFRSCLQSFGKRNRNTRLWTSNIMKTMIDAPHIHELMDRAGGIPGENGHPIPATGQVTMERIITIDPNNMSHLVKSFEWSADSRLLFGTIETLDQGEGTPGNRFMMNILQGMIPSFSLRSLVPQRRNKDGSIDVTGPGRFITYDRVILPSHEEAYMDQSIPVRNIIKKNTFDTCMESFTELILDRSEKVNRILDGMHPVYESAHIDQNGNLSIATEASGHVIIPVEKNYKMDIQNFMLNI